MISVDSFGGNGKFERCEPMHGSSFDESKHPRDESGKFSDTGGGEASVTTRPPAVSKERYAKSDPQSRYLGPEIKAAEPEEIAAFKSSFGRGTAG